MTDAGGISLTLAASRIRTEGSRENPLKNSSMGDGVLNVSPGQLDTLSWSNTALTMGLQLACYHAGRPGAIHLGAIYPYTSS